MHGLGDAQREHRLARAARQHHRRPAAPAAAIAALTNATLATLTDTTLATVTAEEDPQHGPSGLALYLAFGGVGATGCLEPRVGGCAPAGAACSLWCCYVVLR